MEEIIIIYPQKIRNIQCVESEFEGLEKSFEKISFILDFQQIDLYPINDTDEIEIIVTNINDSIKRTSNQFLDQLIGKSVFTTWKCVNSQGYFDLFILGIETIRPTVSILCEGSSLKVWQCSL